MDITDYLQALKRHALLILLLGFLGALLAYGVAAKIPPTYSATGKVFVSARSGSTTSELVQGSTFAQNLMQSYTELAKMPSVLEPVIDELGLEATPNSLARSISSDTPLNTVIIRISAQSSTPRGAADLANAVSRQLALTAQGTAPLQDDGKPAILLRQVAAAAPPLNPIAPNIRLMTLTGLGIGLLVGAVFALVRNALDPRIRRVQDIERAVGIRRSTEIGVYVGVNSEGGVGWASVEPYRRMAADLQFGKTNTQIRSVAVTSSFSNEGAAAAAVNLALALAETNPRVLLVDSDFRESAVTRLCGLGEGRGLESVLQEDAPLDDAVVKWRTISVLPAGHVVSDAGQLLASLNFSQYLLEMTKSYDVVVLCTAPLLTVSDAYPVVHQTSAVVLSTLCGKSKAGDVGQSVSTLESLSKPLRGIVLSPISKHKNLRGRRSAQAADRALASENAMARTPGDRHDSGVQYPLSR